MLPSAQLHVTGAVTLSHLLSVGREQLCDALLAPHVQVKTALRGAEVEDDYADTEGGGLYQHTHML